MPIHVFATLVLARAPSTSVANTWMGAAVGGLLGCDWSDCTGPSASVWLTRRVCAGRVNGSTPLFVPSAKTPLPLASDRVYSWAVRVWDEGLAPSDFSKAAKFSTGLLDQSDWGEAKWIIGGNKLGEARMLRKVSDSGHSARTRSSPAPSLLALRTACYALLATHCCAALSSRKEFNVSSAELGRVSLYVSACQYVILYLDGARIGDHELDVVWTKFAENRSYVTYLSLSAFL